MSTLHDLERGAQRDLASLDYWARTRTAIIERWVKSSGARDVVDVGCGSGYLCARLARDNRRVLGIDIDEQSIAAADARDSRAVFICADVATEQIDATFDLAICADVLEHFEDPTPAVNALVDLLRPGGQLVVSVPNHPWLYGPHDANQDHARRYSLSLLRQHLAPGFEYQRHRYTNALPLPAYALMQKVVKRDVPSSTRGEHSPAVELLKSCAVHAETHVPWPFGITLLAQFEYNGSP